MRNIEPAELSAFMDGELSPQRAAEVSEEVQRNPDLKAELARLRDLDASCRAAGASATFTPNVTLPAKRFSFSTALAITVALASLLLSFSPLASSVRCPLVQTHEREEGMW